MRNVWMILTLGLTAFLYGEKIAVSAAKSTSSTDDLYLEEAGSGGYPEDDDDFTSGSGSGTGEVIEETVTVKTLFIVPKAEPTQDSTKDFTPKVETSTSRDVPEDTKKRVRIEVGTSCKDPVPTTEDSRRNPVTSTTSLPRSHLEVQSENLFQRTEVLAAVIAGGVIGFLFAIFLILLLVYRMRKKDEGSYDLGERKPSGAAYQKAPTKEFYA
ncbi:syndecan-2-like isoform X1 [Sinocyclocheilus rhinocerous]|uniref:syndecan-2-like isoform X1 n=1 Tax=Sinocyclocheilus rhinocerous TaxID=307959 RepID=UPI0007BA3034|nr:PREDICTED: syndecan-2-like isoform X1 [Sinocyclocheilus rhinocerous]